MARDTVVKRPAGLQWIAGAIADLEQRQLELQGRMEADLAEAEANEQLLADLRHLRQQC